jgi:hypothetical protein
MFHVVRCLLTSKMEEVGFSKILVCTRLFIGCHIQEDCTFFLVQQPKLGLSCLIIDVSRSYTDTPSRTPLNE